MPLADGAVVDQAGWPHRLRGEDRRWALEKHTAGSEPENSQVDDLAKTLESLGIMLTGGS